MKIAVDWDGTLVDGKTQEWLDGAVHALHNLIRHGHDVVIHTSRANYPEGLALVRQKLAGERLPLAVFPKPRADLYIDDKALAFESWGSIWRQLPRPRRKAAL